MKIRAAVDLGSKRLNITAMDAGRIARKGDGSAGVEEATDRDFAPCKVNWFLEIERKREDGFHEITTEMETIDWGDTVFGRARSDGALSLQVFGDEDLAGALGPVSENLVLRAARLMQEACQYRGENPGKLGADLWLEKRVPPGAGLGGGSSDAVAAMRLLARLWGVRIGADELVRMAAALGSDTAFFVRGGRALCTGRGEVVTPLPEAGTRHLVVVWPGFGVSTVAVYRSGLIDLLGERHPWVERGQGVWVGFNRLESACVAVEPRMAKVLGLAAGALVEARGSAPKMMVSGSGSAFIVAAESWAQAGELAGILARVFPAPARIRACRTVAGA